MVKHSQWNLLALFGAMPALALAQESVSVEEIVVTAQRRSQSIQDVPISMSAISADMLENLHAVRSDRLFNLVPGVSTLSYGMLGSASVSIRGVGSLLVNQGVEQNVALYVDDVVIGTSQAYDTGLLDIERVEVLRGPQGTLYGKNSVGGAFRFFSRQPEPIGSVGFDAAYGNDGLYEVRGVLNVPVGERFAWRLSAGAQGRDPVIENTTDNGPDLQDEDSRGARLQMKYELSETTSANLSLDASRDRQTGLAVRPFDAALVRQTDIDEASIEERELYGASLTLNHRMAAWDLTSVSAWRRMEYALFGDGDSTSLPLVVSDQTTEFEQFTQEVRLAGPTDGALSWLFGAFYYRDTTAGGNGVTLLDAGPAFMLPYGYFESSFADIDTQTLAAFTDATFQVTTKFSLSAGLRYTYDSKDIRYVHDSNYAAFGGVLAAVQTQSASRRDDMISPRLVATLRWNEDLMTYASATRGVKGGGFNALFVPAGDTLPIGPEKAWNYEVGVKSDWLEQRLTFNAAAFYFDWRDQQVSVLLPGSFGLTTRRNAAQSRSTGGELEWTFRPIAGLMLSLGYAYNDAHFVTYRDAPTGDLSGNDMPNTSRHHFMGQLEAKRPIRGDLSLVFSAGYTYKSAQFLDPENTLRQPDYDLVNARLGIETPRWGVALFAENLLDEIYRTSAFVNFLGQPSATINNPRSYGVRFYHRGLAR